MSDLFVAAPSIQESLPNMVLEAMACCISCVTFNRGRILDMTEHKKTGYLARPYEPEDLADQERKGGLFRSSRQKIDEGFSDESIAARYASLYGEMLSERMTPPREFACI